MEPVNLSELAVLLKTEGSWTDTASVLSDHLGLEGGARIDKHKIKDHFYETGGQLNEESGYARTAAKIASELGFVEHKGFLTKPHRILEELAEACFRAITYRDCACLVSDAFDLTGRGRVTEQVFHSAIVEARTALIAETDATNMQAYRRAIETLASEHGFEVRDGLIFRKSLVEGRSDDECPDCHDGEDEPTYYVLRARIKELELQLGTAEQHKRVAEEALEAERRSSAERGAMAERLSADVQGLTAHVAELEDQRSELLNELNEVKAEKQVLANGVNVSLNLRQRLAEALEQLQTETLLRTKAEALVSVHVRLSDVARQQRLLAQADEALLEAQKKYAAACKLVDMPAQHRVKCRYDAATGSWVALEHSQPVEDA